MNNITIKVKLIILSIFVSLGFIAIVLMENKDIDDLHELAIMEKVVKDLEVQMLTLRRHEKDFLARKDLKYLSKFKNTVTTIDKLSKKLKEELEHFNLNANSVDNYNKIIHKYSDIFNKLVATQQEIGLNPKDGLYGSLRATVQKVQEYAKNANDTKLLAAVYDLRKQEKDFMLRYDLKYLEKFNSKLDKLKANPDYSNMSNLLTKYKKDFNTLVLLEEKKGLDSKSGILGEMRKTIHKSEETLKTMIQIVEQALEDKTSSIKLVALIFSSIIAAVVVLLLLYISRIIAIELKDFEKGLMQFFRFLNNEISDVKPLKDINGDEIGNMAKAVNKHIVSTKENIKNDRKVIDDSIAVLAEFEKGDLTQRVHVHTSNAALEELATLLNQMGTKLEKNIDNILDILKEYENQNFMNSVSTDGIKEHLLRLAEGINSLGDASTSTLVARKRNGLILENNATVLKANVDSLSTSSHEAAASLEETAAALEEITGTITNNTQNVSKMATYANNVTDSASSGENMANKTMSAMDDINNQVKSITEAISVIDKIAFQTNILSLNAAVEAATAGEAGKGFAVVAQEVRNLASRSAEAAKEIKDIVETATVKANAGKTIAQDMLNGYKGLNQDIDKTIELIKSVDVASKEQKSGIEQINDAVNKLDQQTQENSNAAMQTNEIALKTEELAINILKGVNENNFKGKDAVKIDEISIQKQSSKPTPKPVVKKEHPKKEESIKEPIKSNETDSDEWESF